MVTTQAWRQAARLSHFAAAVGLFTLAGVAPATAGPIVLSATARSTPNESCNGGTPVTQTSTTLAIAQYACADLRGAVSAQAIAAPGSLGVSSDGDHTGFNDTPLAQYGEAFYSDTITFSRLDPLLPDTVLVSLSVDLDGSMVGSATLNGRVDLINVFNASFSIDPNFAFASPGFTVTGSTNPAAFDARLTTFAGTAFIGQPYLLEMRMTGVTYVNSGSAATLDFLHTLGFPTDGPVFNLPDGYTANAGNYLVNNRFVSAVAPPTAVPEPGTLTLVGMTIAGLLVRRKLSAGGWVARRRRT